MPEIIETEDGPRIRYSEEEWHECVHPVDGSLGPHVRGKDERGIYCVVCEKILDKTTFVR